MKEQVALAKDKYTDAESKAFKQYQDTLLKAKGYLPSTVKDQSEFGSVTDFENGLAVQRVTIDDFERRIKKFADQELGDLITLELLIEAFKDHAALKQIEQEDSVLRKLLTHPILSDAPGTISIPSLMLFGILYCGSNSQAKAQKFFDLCQIELQPHVSSKDKELLAYFKKLIEISYTLIIEVFNENNPVQANKDWLVDVNGAGD